MTQKKIGAKDHVGEVHGIFTLVEVSDNKDKYGHYIYKGVCNECGYVKYSHYGDFSGKSSKATICSHVELGGRYLTNVRWDNRRIGNIFRGMKERCYNPKERAYRWYGAKGIRVCDEWLDNPKLFEEWSMANGYSDSLTIDRIDEDKDYCPTNCRWVTPTNNSRYKSTTSLIEVDGEIHTGREWADKLGIGTNRINIYVQKYGIDNTIEFIRRRLAKPNIDLNGKRNFYDIYMSDNSVGVN